jgi:NAD(P)-dependent dehydrogenase (short-subunit alcohol dehydrogenase family)
MESTMKGLLEDKVTLVTGAAAGIGRTIVRHLADVGAVGLGFDIAARGMDLPNGWITWPGDVCSEDDVSDAVEAVRNEFGRLDVVVANAGVVPPWRETEAIDLDEWDRVFAVNVRGVIATIKHAVPLMKATGGSIVILGSLNSHRAHPRQCLYTASKHAVLGITRSVALDLGRFDIRVNALGPGPIATEALLERIDARAKSGGPAATEALQQYAAETALGRLATEDDVARAALFLASDHSSGISGQILPVDAGLP